MVIERMEQVPYVDLKRKAKARFGPKRGELLWNTESGQVEGEIRNWKDVLAVLGAHVLGRLEGPRIGRPRGSTLATDDEFRKEYSEVEDMLTKFPNKRNRKHQAAHPSTTETAQAMGTCWWDTKRNRPTSTFWTYKRRQIAKP